MNHSNIIIDTDKYFEIDPITRAIKNMSPTKTTVIQHDHKSERFSFVLPRMIEGHDMMECNRIEVHYTNNGKPGLYEVSDLAVCADDDTMVCCSWLLTQNATKEVGSLHFTLRFACITEDGTVDYAWNTAKFKGISISEGLYNSEAIAEKYADVLEQWKNELMPTESESTFVVYPYNFGPGGVPVSTNKTTEEMCEAYGKGKVIVYENRPMFPGIGDPTEIYTLMSICSSEVVFGRTAADGTLKTYTIRGQNISGEDILPAPNIDEIVQEVITALPNGDEVYY